MYRGDEDELSYRLAPDAYPKLVDEIASRIPLSCIHLGTPIANVNYSGFDNSNNDDDAGVSALCHVPRKARLDCGFRLGCASPLRTDSDTSTIM